MGWARFADHVVHEEAVASYLLFDSNVVYYAAMPDLESCSKVSSEGRREP